MLKIALLLLGAASMPVGLSFAQSSPVQTVPVPVGPVPVSPVPQDPVAPPAAKPVQNTEPLPASTAKGKGMQGLAAPPAIPRSETGSSFIIGSEDSLAIRVWDEPNLSGPVTVGPDGMIALPLIHEVKASGLTPLQLEAALTERLKEFRNNPEVSIQVIQVRSRKYFLQGGFNRTGVFPLTGPTTIMEALISGGGFKEFSDRKKIYVLRMKPDGTSVKIKFNYNEVIKGKNMKQNIFLQNGDYVIVPE